MSVQVKSTKYWEAYFWCNKKEKQKVENTNKEKPLPSIDDILIVTSNGYAYSFYN